VPEPAHRLPLAERRRLDPARAYAAVHELERDAAGGLASTAVLFLTNRQCPFECVMCDLWVNTIEQTLPAGAIPGQIRDALASLPIATQVKLYNAGSFFDPQAIPPGDDEAIAALVAGFDRVIVEAHPAFLRGVYGERCLAFRDRLVNAGDRNDQREGARLEVAIGLETAHPGVLARLNKRMTLDDFRDAAAFLRGQDIDVRAFILLQPPFMLADESIEWGCRSIDTAFDAGADVCSIIPTRGSAPPSLEQLESVIEYGLCLGRGRVFADLWDIERFFACTCSPQRAARLRMMNETQQIPPPVLCACAARR
jgi:archaeosine synthase beta-subunit